MSLRCWLWCTSLWISSTDSRRVVNWDKKTQSLALAPVQLDSISGADVFGQCPTDNAVCVAIRFRPPNPGENCEARAPKEVCASVACTLNVNVPPGTPGMPKGCARCLEINEQGKSPTFHPFDVIMPYDVETDVAPTNEEVANLLVSPMMQRALACREEGKACQGSSFFAYGATGSGKSYTMGFEKDLIETNPGILQLGMTEMFGELQKMKEAGTSRERNLGKLKVWMSFFELYGADAQGSSVFDLMAPKRPDKGLRGKSQDFVRGSLTYREAPDLKTMNELFKSGASRRAVGGTGMNAKSSRSHAIVEFFLVDPAKDLSKLSSQERVRLLGNSVSITWVDLAGSEKPNWMDEEKWPGLKKEVRHVRTEEGKVINRGLSMLAQCIGHTAGLNMECSPRADMLTTMLKHIFDKDASGTAKINTRMLATMNPSGDPEQVSLTSSTVDFATRVKKIKLALPQGVRGNQLVAQRPEEVIADLQMEVAALKEQNSALQLEKAACEEMLAGKGGSNDTDPKALLQIISELKLERQSLKAELNEAIEAARAARQEVPVETSSNPEIQLLEQQVLDANAEARRYREAWNRAQAEIAALDAQLRDKPQEDEVAAAKIALDAAKLQTALTEAADAKRDAGRLKLVLQQKDDELEKIRQEAETARADASSCQMHVDMQEGRIRALQEENAALRKASESQEAEDEQADSTECDLRAKGVALAEKASSTALADLHAKIEMLQAIVKQDLERQAMLSRLEERSADKAVVWKFWKLHGDFSHFEALIGRALGPVQRQLLNAPKAIQWLKQALSKSKKKKDPLKESIKQGLAELQAAIREAGGATVVNGSVEWPEVSKGQRGEFISQLKLAEISVQIYNDLLDQQPSNFVGGFEKLQDGLAKSLCDLSQILEEGTGVCKMSDATVGLICE